MPSVALARGGVPPVPPSGLTDTYGAQKTLAVLVNFQDHSLPADFTNWEARMAMAGATNFVHEASYGKTWLTAIVDVPFNVADVRGPYNIPISAPTTCDDAALSLISFWAKFSAGWGGGVNPSLHNRFVIFFPETASCDFSGRSMGRDSFINGNLDVKVITHELGHYNAFQKERLGWLNFNGTPPGWPRRSRSRSPSISPPGR